MNAIDFFRMHLEIKTDQELSSVFSKKITYVLRGNGLWEIRKNNIATFFLHRADINLFGFSDDSYHEGFVLHLPKIPSSILKTIVAFFRKVAQQSRTECYVQIFWNPEEKKYYVECPEQVVTSIKVAYNQADVPIDHILVCEVHSHNVMDAFFSSDDNRDELPRGDRFFGVIGKLGADNYYDMRLSYVAGGIRVLIPVKSIFDIEDEVSFPEEWLAKVKFGEEGTSVSVEDEDTLEEVEAEEEFYEYHEKKY